MVGWMHGWMDGWVDGWIVITNKHVGTKFSIVVLNR